MKKRSDILDLPIVCIDEGIEFGKIKELIIDPDKGKVVYLIIDDGNWYLGAKLLELDDILGIGKDAVTTQTIENIKEIREDDKVLELVKKGIKVVGTKIYSQNGEYIGLVEEFYLDQKDGTIIRCVLEGTDGKEEISASSVITYGKNVLIVEDDIEKNVLKSSDENVEQFIPDEFERKQSKEKENIFESRQRQFVLGRRATKTIKDTDGNEIVREGQTIDEHIVEKIVDAGKLVELTMNIQ